MLLYMIVKFEIRLEQTVTYQNKWVKFDTLKSQQGNSLSNLNLKILIKRTEKEKIFILKYQCLLMSSLL